MSSNFHTVVSMKRLKLDPMAMKTAVHKILTKLPTKSVSRFRCVSKLWHSLTHGHDFASLQFRNELDVGNGDITILNFPEGASYFSLYHYRGDGHKFSSNIGKDDFVLGISNSCNGLVCVFLHGDTIVVNLHTGDHVLLPKGSLDEERQYVSTGGLVYNPSTGEYKVVRLMQRVWGSKLKSEIFDQGSRSWRKVDDAPLVVPSSTHVFVEGFIFLSATDERVDFFDLQKESFGRLCHPNMPLPGRWYPTKQVSIGEWAGHLCLADTKWYEPEMGLWVLQDNYLGTWEKLFTISLSTLDNWHMSYNKRLRPLVLWNGKLVLTDGRGRLDRYDFQTKSFHKLHWGDSSSDHCAVFYVESNVSPHVILEGSAAEVYMDMDVHAVGLSAGDGGIQALTKFSGLEPDIDEGRLADVLYRHYSSSEDGFLQRS